MAHFCLHSAWLFAVSKDHPGLPFACVIILFTSYPAPQDLSGRCASSSTHCCCCADGDSLGETLGDDDTGDADGDIDGTVVDGEADGDEDGDAVGD